jgi:hypothetical protein
MEKRLLKKELKYLANNFNKRTFYELLSASESDNMFFEIFKVVEQYV